MNDYGEHEHNNALRLSEKPKSNWRLRSIVERVERLHEEKKALGNDVRDILTEAKSAGYNVKVIRALIAERAKEPAEVNALQRELDLYRDEVGR